MADGRPGRGSDQFILRFPPGMRDEIKRLATEDGRSMNAQIIALLNFSLQNSGLDLDEIFRMISEQRVEIARLRRDLEGSSQTVAPGSDMHLTPADLAAIVQAVKEALKSELR